MDFSQMVMICLDMDAFTDNKNYFKIPLIVRWKDEI